MRIVLKKKSRAFIFGGAMLLGAVFALKYGQTVNAGLGILTALAFILCYTKNFTSLYIFSFFIPLNMYFMYVPVPFLAGKTFNGLMNLCGFVAALLSLIYILGVRRGRLKSRTLEIGIYIYCVAAIIYYPLNCYVHHGNILEMLWRLAPLMNCVALMYLTQKEKYFDEFVIVLILSAIIFVSIGYFELFRGSTFYYSSWTGAERYRHGILRMGSTLGDPNTLAEYTVPIIFLLNTGKVKKLIGKKTSSFLMLMFILLVFLTSSRMSLLALLCGYGFYNLIHDKSWKRAAAVFILVFGIISLPYLFSFFNNMDTDSSGMRLFLLGRAIVNWRENILFGIGSDQFVIREYWMNMNEWMKQLSEFGSLGFLLYIAFYTVIFLYYFQNKGKLNKSERKDAVLILSAVVAFGLNSLSMDTYYHYIMWALPPLAGYFFLPHDNKSENY